MLYEFVSWKSVGAGAELVSSGMTHSAGPLSVPMFCLLLVFHDGTLTSVRFNPKTLLDSTWLYSGNALTCDTGSILFTGG